MLHITSNYTLQTLCGDPHKVCNEEGKLDGYELNRAIVGKDIIAGTFFLSGIDEEDLTDLPDELAEKYEALFRSPQVSVRIPRGILVLTENGAEVFLDVEEPDKKLLKALNESRNSFSFLLLKEKLNDMYCIAIRSAYKVEESGSGDDFTEFIYAKAAPLDDDTTERDMIIGLMQSAS